MIRRTCSLEWMKGIFNRSRQSEVRQPVRSLVVGQACELEDILSIGAIADNNERAIDQERTIEESIKHFKY
jgi:hypothetical protein